MPVDHAPPSGNDANVSPGKKIASIAMKYPEEPELIAEKAMEILKGKGTKVGPTSQSQGAQSPQDQGAQSPQDQGGQSPQDQGGQSPQDQGGQSPEDIVLNDRNAPTGTTTLAKPQNITGQQSSEEDAGAWAWPKQPLRDTDSDNGGRTGARDSR